MTEPSGGDVTYEAIGLGVAVKRGLLDASLYGSDVDDWNSGIWRCEDGVPVAFIGDDVCEPEDSVIRRDWRWIVTALQAAYDLGQAQTGRGGSDGVS